MTYKLYFDGGSRGNPGNAGYGFVLMKDEEIVKEGWGYISDSQTNNFAEYTGLLEGLKYCKSQGIKELVVYGDSNLILNQVFGTFKTNASNLIEINRKTKDYLKYFDKIDWKHVKRHLNKHADMLANRAIDTKTSS